MQSCYHIVIITFIKILIKQLLFIESARAGEHGCGFPMLDDEVRSLAEPTQQSVSEIAVSIGHIFELMDNTRK